MKYVLSLGVLSQHDWLQTRDSYIKSGEVKTIKSEIKVNFYSFQILPFFFFLIFKLFNNFKSKLISGFGCISNWLFSSGKEIWIITLSLLCYETENNLDLLYKSLQKLNDFHCTNTRFKAYLSFSTCPEPLFQKKVYCDRSNQGKLNSYKILIRIMFLSVEARTK